MGIQRLMSPAIHPTWPSTKQKIQEECITRGPKSTVPVVSATTGGVLKASAPGQLPRKEKQVTNFKAKSVVQSRASRFPQLSLVAAADDLFVVMQQVYTEDTSKFVCSVNAAPEPAVIVATESQLQNLASALHLLNFRSSQWTPHFVWVTLTLH